MYLRPYDIDTPDETAFPMSDQGMFCYRPYGGRGRLLIRIAINVAKDCGFNERMQKCKF
jgi:hypothetical protein